MPSYVCILFFFPSVILPKVDRLLLYWCRCRCRYFCCALLRVIVIVSHIHHCSTVNNTIFAEKKCVQIENFVHSGVGVAVCRWSGCCCHPHTNCQIRKSIGCLARPIVIGLYVTNRRLAFVSSIVNCPRMFRINYGHELLVLRLPTNIWCGLATNEPKTKKKNERNQMCSIRTPFSLFNRNELRIYWYSHFVSYRTHIAWQMEPFLHLRLFSFTPPYICIKYTFCVIRREIQERKKMHIVVGSWRSRWAQGTHSHFLNFIAAFISRLHSAASWRLAIMLHATDSRCRRFAALKLHDDKKMSARVWGIVKVL